MKISINANLVDGPWGGANQFASYFSEYLKDKGVSVIDHLNEPGVDLIFMIHPNPALSVVKYGTAAIENYFGKYGKVPVIHRINSCDERRGSSDENPLTVELSKYVTHAVYISTFLMDILKAYGYSESIPQSVILNGADEKVFNSEGSATWNGEDPLKIVTHHFSNNYMKGFDIYERLDQLLDLPEYRNKYEFSVVGNVPPGVVFKNSTVVPPIAGKELGDELRKHHVYLTATRNEPAGMHHVEGMMCGLPVLHLDSGALPEYDGDYGVEFRLINFEEKLEEIRDRYNTLRDKVLTAPYTAGRMADEFWALIEKVVEENPAEKTNRSFISRIFG